MREQATIRRRRRVDGTRAHLGDRVRVALQHQPVEQVPAAPERRDAACCHNDATEEDRQHERRSEPRRRDGKRERGDGDGDGSVLPLLVTELAQPALRMLDCSGDHLDPSIAVAGIARIGPSRRPVAAFPHRTGGGERTRRATRGTIIGP